MIEIIRDKDKLNREVWEFNFYEINRRPVVILDTYHKQNRFTPRHKWTSSEYWSRLGRNSSLKVDEIPLPADVVQEAKDKFVEMVEVRKELRG